eukprot:gene15448-17030_t
MTIDAQMSRAYDNDATVMPGQSDGIPIVLITTQEDSDDDDSEDEWLDCLPLPSSKYRYTKWYEIENIPISSSMLKAPRVRRAPKCYEKTTIDTIQEEDENYLGIDLESGVQPAKRKKKGKGRKKHFRAIENWETCECVNLSYQDLGHRYQWKEFYHILRRLVRCSEIELIEDSLTDLHTVAFPSCKTLYLQRNYLTSLKKLPKLPNIEHLSLQQNNISSLDGLEVLQRSRLKSLILEGNPVALEKNYRKNVFRTVPSLLLLDGIPKLPCDEYTNSDKDSKSGKCTVS